MGGSLFPQRMEYFSCEIVEAHFFLPPVSATAATP